MVVDYETGKDTHDEPLGAPATSLLAAVWHASIQVQREDGVCKVRHADASRLACSGRAWHSARSGSGGQGKGLAGRLAGRQASCWRGDAVRIAGMSFGREESMDRGWSEREL